MNVGDFLHRVYLAVVRTSSPHFLNELAPTLEPLCQTGNVDVRNAIDRLALMRFRFVQLSATQSGLRPRELDRSARRDLLAIFRRAELTVAGLDFWIPPEHFIAAEHADRAMTAMQQAIELAADLGRVPISFALPQRKSEQNESESLTSLIEALTTQAERYGVLLANHAVPPDKTNDWIGAGIDPCAWMSNGKDPAEAARNLQPMAARVCDLLTTGMRGPIGDLRSGKLDLRQYKIALSFNDLAQPLVIDARQWSEPWEGIQQSQHAWTALP